jgi:DNA-binding response OmpR family regulator
MLYRRFIPTILVVDDDLETVGLLRIVLQRAGYTVVTATRWDEVTDRLQILNQQGQTIDLIILDIMMPDLNGFDLYRSLEVVLYPMPPVIFLSAKCMLEDMVKASDLGAAKYLTKPTTPDKLLKTVQEVLNQIGK